MPKPNQSVTDKVNHVFIIVLNPTGCCIFIIANLCVEPRTHKNEVKAVPNTLKCGAKGSRPSIQMRRVGVEWI